jgi:hypothetical protein
MEAYAMAMGPIRQTSQFWWLAGCGVVQNSSLHRLGRLASLHELQPDGSVLRRQHLQVAKGAGGLVWTYFHGAETFSERLANQTDAAHRSHDGVLDGKEERKS